MVVKLRLSRRGRTGLPFYWLVIANSTSPRDGKFISKVGFYNPTSKKDKLSITKPDVITCYFDNGMQCTDTVARLLNNYGFEHKSLLKAKIYNKSSKKPENTSVESDETAQ